MKGSFAGRIRRAARDLHEKSGGKPVTVEQLSEEAGVQIYDDRKRIRSVIRDFVRSGEVRRVGEGAYLYVFRERKEPQKQEIMWRFFRMQKSLTADDLRLAAGVSLDYAQEWLRGLAKMGLVRVFDGGLHQLVTDQVEMPLNDAKAERLRKLRERKKSAVLAALRDAGEAIGKAEQMILGLDDRGDKSDE